MHWYRLTPEWSHPVFRGFSGQSSFHHSRYTHKKIARCLEYTCLGPLKGTTAPEKQKQGVASFWKKSHVILPVSRLKVCFYIFYNIFNTGQADKVLCVQGLLWTDLVQSQTNDCLQFFSEAVVYYLAMAKLIHSLSVRDFWKSHAGGRSFFILHIKQLELYNAWLARYKSSLIHKSLASYIAFFVHSLKLCRNSRKFVDAGIYLDDS